MEKLLRSAINTVVSKVYRVQPSGYERKLQYFLEGGNYPLWPIFVEGNRKESNRNCEKCKDVHREVRRGSRELFKKLRRKFKLVRSSVQMENNRFSTNFGCAAIFIPNMVRRIGGAENRKDGDDCDDLVRNVINIESMKCRQLMEGTRS